MRIYSDLIKLDTFEERFRYLKLDGKVGEETFGWNRILNQIFYKYNDEWQRVRKEVILRDFGCDLGIKEHEIFGKIFVHHMNPITENDFVFMNKDLLNPEFLITTSLITHNAIHYGNESLLMNNTFIERRANDTIPWKK